MIPPPTNEIQSFYSRLGMGELTEALLTELVSNGLRDLETRYHQLTKKGIENSGLKSSNLKGIIHQGACYRFDQFRASVLRYLRLNKKDITILPL